MQTEVHVHLITSKKALKFKKETKYFQNEKIWTSKLTQMDARQDKRRFKKML